MSQAVTAYGRTTTPGETTITAEMDPFQQCLDALQDEDCRAILAVTSTTARSATELSERCDLPLSTTYRKLDLLTDAGLLEERTRIRRSGKHASEYVRGVEDVCLSMAEDGDLHIVLSHRSAAEH